jgi:uncharacterized membrane-anchored protein YitT (DUF2179 family)
MLQKSKMHPLKRLLFVTLSAILFAININTFVHAGALIPGGFTGLSLLLGEIGGKFFGLKIPFGITLIILNTIPALICFRYIGKYFTLFSCINILFSAFLTDFLPTMFITFLQMHDNLLCAIYGGLLNAIAISLCLLVNATSGGTDFIAIFFAEKKGRDMWNIIFAGNCAILIIAGFLFSLEKALYSIIFQFTTTMALNFMYRGYQQCTLLIITNNPEDVYKCIRDTTNHDATSFTGLGRYQMTKREMLYSVVASNEVQSLINDIKKIDTSAFINILKTERLNGKFFRRPKD